MDFGPAGGERAGFTGHSIGRTPVGLFRRKTKTEDESQRCPRCRERVPEGADECVMCGVDLRPLRRGSSDRQGETPVRAGR
jgi:hypothetical protein